MAVYKHSMEARLTESEERYRSLFEQMTHGFALYEVVVDDDGRAVDLRFLAVNPAYEQMAARDASLLVGSTELQIFPESAPMGFIENVARVAFTGVPAQFDFYVTPIDRYYSFKAYSIKHGEVAVISEDRTEQKKAEMELRDSYARLEQSLRRMTLLRNIDQAIISLGDLDSLAESVLNHAIDPMEVDAAALFVPQGFGERVTRGHTDLLTARGSLRAVGFAGFPDAAHTREIRDFQMELSLRAYDRGKPIYISDLRQESHPGAAALFHATGFTGCAVLPLIGHALTRGVLHVYRFQINLTDLGWQSFIQSLALQVAIAIDTMEMLEGLRHSNDELSNAYDSTIRALALSLEERGKEAPDHSDRVVDLSTRLAEIMGVKAREMQHFLRGVILHDFGKIVIPDRILHKTGPLTEEDWVTMRQHPEKAYRLLSGIQFLEPALKVVLYHHEHWDGTGYPHGLKGEEIPKWARIFAVIDVYDALTTPRTYRLAWPKEETLAYIARESGKHFDPQVAGAFLKMMRTA
jgi:HD-GYP domain-containing protein (c-di-GMP phosphodiesterase class II)